MVPTLTLNWLLGWRVLHCQTRREVTKLTLSEPQVGQTTPLGQRSHDQIIQAVIGIGEVDNRVFESGWFVRHELTIEDLS
jgi:hypothetical protein